LRFGVPATTSQLGFIIIQNIYNGARQGMRLRLPCPSSSLNNYKIHLVLSTFQHVKTCYVKAKMTWPSHIRQEEEEERKILSYNSSAKGDLGLR